MTTFWGDGRGLDVVAPVLVTRCLVQLLFVLLSVSTKDFGVNADEGVITML